MKKILAFVLAMVLCVSFATVAVSVLGAETATETPDTPTFDPSKPYFKVADVEVTEEALAESSQVVVPISVVNNPGIWGFKLQVELGEGLTYVDLEGAVSEAMPANSFLPNDEEMLITFDGPSFTENVEGDVVVANLTVTQQWAIPMKSVWLQWMLVIAWQLMRQWFRPRSKACSMSAAALLLLKHRLLAQPLRLPKLRMSPNPAMLLLQPLRLTRAPARSQALWQLRLQQLLWQQQQLS